MSKSKQRKVSIARQKQINAKRKAQLESAYQPIEFSTVIKPFPVGLWLGSIAVGVVLLVLGVLIWHSLLRI